MEIFDYAGNSAKARTLIVADQENRVTIEDESALTADPGQTSQTGMIWIAESGTFTIQWAGVFANTHHINNHFLDEVARINGLDIDDDGADIGKPFRVTCKLYI